VAGASRCRLERAVKCKNKLKEPHCNRNCPSANDVSDAAVAAATHPSSAASSGASRTPTARDMNSKGSIFNSPERGQFSTAVDHLLVQQTFPRPCT